MAISIGTNCGFVTSRPTANPAFTGTDIADDKMLAIKVTAPVGTNSLTEIGWYCHNATEAADFQVGIYSHDSGSNKPGNRLAVSSDTAKGTAAGWKYASVSYSLVASTTYWLAVQLDDTATNTQIDFDEPVGERISQMFTVTSLPDPWAAGSSEFNDQYYAIYGLYSGSGTSVYYLGV